MGSVNASFISDARILAHDILTESTDTIEKGLSRFSARLVGAIFSQGPGFALCDALVDGQKLGQIDAKLLRLGLSPMDNTSEDYEKAVAARDLQKEIYTNVKKYTETSQKIKSLIALCGLVATVAAVTNNQDLFVCAVVTNLSAITYGTYRYFTEGNTLVSNNQALVRQAWPMIAQ